MRLFRLLTSLALMSCSGAPEETELSAPPPERPAPERPAPEQTAPAEPAEVAPRYVAFSDVQWDQLNPARGDASPMAATLWGDRGGERATGFLLRPRDGFESPPHIHNVTYRGVVLEGLIHNDDPNAARMWMPGGSFWTQPRGAVHITAARGEATLAYIEIDEGPYLVRPTDAAFETPERPVNIDASNVVWTTPSGVDSEVQLAYLWGEVGVRVGVFVKLSASAGAFLEGAEFRAVVVEGQPSHRNEAREEVVMNPGDLLTGTGRTWLGCDSARACMLYVRAEGRVELSAPAN